MRFEEPLSFKDALDDAGRWSVGPPALFAGNGLSLEWNQENFAYDSLLGETSSTLPRVVREVFKRFGTVNFEAVIRRIEDATTVAEIYGRVPDFRSKLTDFQARLQEDLAQTRDAFSHALRLHHPDDASMVAAPQRRAFSSFLTNFSELFTANYDLLLYWVMNGNKSLQNRFKDGFVSSGLGTPLIWSTRSEKQTTHYMHGALHLVRRDSGELEKLPLGMTGMPMSAVVRQNLIAGLTPLIISEGKSELKLARIRADAYLRHCYSALSRIEVPLFVHGFSFSEQDAHICQAIVESQCPEIYVSLHSREDLLREAVEHMILARGKRGKTHPSLRVTYYDAMSAHPWGMQA
jgi:hypothetical protein